MVGSSCDGGKGLPQGKATLLQGSPGVREKESPKQQSLVLLMCPDGHLAEREEPGGPGRGLVGPSGAAVPVAATTESPGRTGHPCTPPAEAADGEALGAGDRLQAREGVTPQNPGSWPESQLGWPAFEYIVYRCHARHQWVVRHSGLPGAPLSKNIAFSRILRVVFWRDSFKNSWKDVRGQSQGTASIPVGIGVKA